MPINVLNVTKYKDEEGNKKIKKITLNLNSYSITSDKNDMSEFMFMVNTNLNYWRPKKKYNHDIKNTGIMDVENYKFILPEKEQNYKVKNLELERIQTIKEINTISLKKLQKITFCKKKRRRKKCK